jgi:hypothetical protein
MDRLYLIQHTRTNHTNAECASVLTTQLTSIPPRSSHTLSFLKMILKKNTHFQDNPPPLEHAFHSQ